MTASKTKLRLKFILIVAISIALVLFIIYIFDRKAQQNAEKFQAKAIPVALEEGKAECLNEGLPNDECSHLIARPLSESSDCGVRLCWVIYVHSPDEEVYGANIQILEDDNGLRAVDYLRNHFKKLEANNDV